MKITYIDIGLHKEAKEIEMMKSIIDDIRHITGKEIELHVYGYEAHPAYVQRLKLRYELEENVEIRQAAICGHHGTAQLYLSPSTDGEGNSIHSTKNNVIENSITVPARKLSDELGSMWESDITILRFNIEGAELEMMEDLIGTNTYQMIDLYCGAPSDIKKVHAIRHKYQQYQDLLESAGIQFLRFHAHYLRNHQREMEQWMEQWILQKMAGIDTSSSHT